MKDPDANMKENVPLSFRAKIFGSGKELQGRFRCPGKRAQVAVLVDAVQCEDGLIRQTFLADSDPAQLVTNNFYLFFSMLHRVDAYLAGDTIKGCIGRAGFSAIKRFSGAVIFGLHLPRGSQCPEDLFYRGE
ncbi:MAG: hypothetical protein WC586_10240 [Methanoregula sp.]